MTLITSSSDNLIKYGHVTYHVILITTAAIYYQSKALIHSTRKMTLFGKDKKIPDGPPSYDDLQAENNNSVGEGDAPMYLGPYGDNEYPQEKGSSSAYGTVDNNGSQGYGNQVPGGNGNSAFNGNGYFNNGSNGAPANYGPGSGHGNGSGFQGTYGIPANTYAVPLQVTNIAYDTEGRVTRPGYKEYLQADQQHVAQGDVPKPRSAFRHGAPLAPSRKGGSLSSGGFPGAKGTTYYNTSEKK